MTEFLITVLGFIRKIFKIYPQLSEHVSLVVDKLLEESLENCRERLSEQLTVESGEVYTLNHYYSDTVLKVMERSFEVVIECTHQASEAALQVRCSHRLLSPLLVTLTTGHSFRIRSSRKAV